MIDDVLGIKIARQSASDTVNPLASMLYSNVLRILLIPGLDAGLLANQTSEAIPAVLELPVPCLSVRAVIESNSL